MMKLFFFSLFLGVFLQVLDSSELALTLEAESGVLLNAKTGRVLFQKNKDEKNFPASTTKIATALYALHLSRNELDRKMVATQEAVASITPQAKKQSNYRSPPHWLETDGTHVGIKKGEEMLFKDLLYAIMVASANDAANVVAQNLGGSIPKFMENLNQYLKRIGCTQTSFNNPHGLHHPSHVTTAYDLALMAKEGLKDPLFRQIVSTMRYICPETNLEHERTFLQTNLLLRKGNFHYPRAIGIKTGTTSIAGKNLIAAAEDESRSLIAVVLNHKGTREGLYRDVIKMFDAAFHEKKKRKVFLQKGEQKITKKIKGANGILKTYITEPLYYEYFSSEEIPVKAHIIWETFSLPCAKGHEVGKVRMMEESGKILKEVRLLAAEELRATFWYKFTNGKIWKRVLFFLTAFSVIFAIWRIRKRA